MKKLTAVEIENNLRELNAASSHGQWELDGVQIHKDFHFRDFIEAMGFMLRVMPEAEKLNHHPDWCNSYNKVVVSLCTHSVGGLTRLDFELALIMEKMVVYNEL
jgi:4a-hydroxytetrahydrobiopterin dehydratase